MQTDANGMPQIEPLIDPSNSSTFNAAFALIAGGVDTMRPIRSFKWADAAARNAQTGMSEGDIGDQADTNTTYRYDGTQWLITSGPLIVGSLTGSANYNVAGSTVEKDTHGYVTVMLRAIRNSGGVLSSEAVATLPAGFRPAANTIAPIAMAALPSAAAQILVSAATGQLDIYTSTPGPATAVYGHIRFKAV